MCRGSSFSGKNSKRRLSNTHEVNRRRKYLLSSRGMCMRARKVRLFKRRSAKALGSSANSRFRELIKDLVA